MLIMKFKKLELCSLFYFFIKQSNFFGCVFSERLNRNKTFEQKHSQVFSLWQVTKMAQLNNLPSLDNSTWVNAGNDTIVDNRTATTVGALILSLVFILGFPGNVFVIWSILARARKQSITTLLILNLAIADGSLMALTPFFIIYLVWKKWIFKRLMCKIIFYLCLANMYASIHLIMLMSLYRVMAVLWPQRISAITGRKMVLRVLVVVWMLVIIASVPALLFRDVRDRSNTMVCEAFHDENSHVSEQET